jgi:hypothetical protein
MSTPQYDVLSAHPRNYLVNGDFFVNQRGLSFSLGSNSNLYSSDRWLAFNASSGGATSTFSLSSDVPTVAQSGWGTFYSMKYTVGTAAASIATNDAIGMQQTIEGSFFSPLRNRKCSLSFWAKTSVAGTYSVSFRSSGASSSYVAPFVVTTPGVWVKYSVVVDFSQDTFGTYSFGNGTGVVVLINFLTGSTFNTTANTWVSGNFLGVSGNTTNIAAISGATFQVWGMMLNEGGAASPFSLMGANPMEERQLCERYYQQLANVPGIASSASNFIFGTRLNPVMRAAPTISATGPLNVQGNGTYNTVQSGVSFGSLFPAYDCIYGNALFSNNGLSTNISAFIAVIANNANYITVNAEY